MVTPRKLKKYLIYEDFLESKNVKLKTFNYNDNKKRCLSSIAPIFGFPNEKYKYGRLFEFKSKQASMNKITNFFVISKIYNLLNKFKKKTKTNFKNKKVNIFNYS